MMGNITSALKDFGLSRLSGKGEGNYSFLVILHSRSVKDSLIKKFDLAKVYDIPESDMTKVRNQFDEYVNITAELEGNFTITVTDKDPQRAADIANNYVEVTNTVSENLFHNESRINREYLEDRLSGINKAVILITDSLQKYSSSKLIFSPLDQAKGISTALSDIKAEIMKQEIMEQMLINRFGENDQSTLQQKSIISELKKKLTSATNEPGFAGNFPVSGATKVGMDFMKLYAEFEAYSKVKAFLMPMLEEAKLNEKRMTQTIFIVDKAMPPEKKSYPKRSLILLGAFSGSIVLGLIFIILLDSLKKLRKKFLTKKAELLNS